MFSIDTHWIVAPILSPLFAAILVILKPRIAVFIGLSASLLTLLASCVLIQRLFQHGVLRYAVGGWSAPLGIDLYLDGLSGFMLMMTSLVGLLIGVYSSAYFRSNVRKMASFWALWLFLLAALHALYLSADIFNLYVTLEMLGLAAVSLVGLAGSVDALTGAMRYLLVNLLASVSFLFGVALLYHSFGTVDIALLAERVVATPASLVAFSLISVGLLFKCGLFPLHFWLPPAHASAPAPVSALLSALVVKAAFYIMIRMWIHVFPFTTELAGQLLATLGAVAIIWGSLMALSQTRLKLLIAYSSIAQLGYLFLAFSLIAQNNTELAWQGALYFALAHALAKSAMFLSAGNIMSVNGHDRMQDMDQAVKRLPLTMFAFGLAGCSILGLPPSGGFVAKWLLLNAFIDHQRWLLVVVMLIGGVLAIGYIFKVIACIFKKVEPLQSDSNVPVVMEWSALTLALAAIVLGMTANVPLSVLDIGSPFNRQGGDIQ